MLPRMKRRKDQQEILNAKGKVPKKKNTKLAIIPTVLARKEHQEESMTRTSTCHISKGKKNLSTNPIHRSSPRLQSQNKSTFGSSITPGKSVDSAYDGDEESSPSTTQSDDDPYSMSAMEDVPKVSKMRKKKRNGAKTSTKAKTNSKKRSSSVLSHTSSTPNQIGQPPVRRSTRISPCLSTTPEITPILPIEPTQHPSSDLSFSTPQIYQLSHKPSSIGSSASPSLNSSSQADSGIAVSPPAKRARIQPGEPRHKSAAVLGKKFMNKRNIFSPNSKHGKKQSEVKENMDSSCFGFSSLELHGVSLEKTEPILGVYRCVQSVTSDSSPTSGSRPSLSTDSDNLTDVSKRHWPSPGLFSDEILSAESGENYVP
ncbi:hypothetical protein PoB_004082100 [Plakobranchus ocellatus]|uniref:Uncharacterized protein n=1 Tax=Plakobranchus ocellatus TaxID=259542 RepID=A0AAV4B1E0_9GAST|nr:hypothetical protein PoB_004082100 [Plakobranchus ocellatus]